MRYQCFPVVHWFVPRICSEFLPKFSFPLDLTQRLLPSLLFRIFQLFQPSWFSNSQDLFFDSYSMKIGVWVFWHIIVDDNVDSFYINASTKNVGCDHDSFLEVFELGIFLNSKEINFVNKETRVKIMHLSSCFRPAWMAIEGKLHSTKILLRWTALGIDFTNIITWLNNRASNKSFNFLLFSFSGISM